MSDELEGQGGETPRDPAGAPAERKGRRRFRPWRRRRGSDREGRGGENEGGRGEREAGAEGRHTQGDDPRETAAVAAEGAPRPEEAPRPAEPRGERGRVRNGMGRDARAGREREGRNGREPRDREPRDREGRDREARDRDARARDGRERPERDGRDRDREVREREREGRGERGGEGRGGDRGASRGRWMRPRPAGAGELGTGRPGAGPREMLRPLPARGPVVAPPSPALRVLIAGGGTGGHIYPALAVADEIRRRNRESQILFVGTRKGLEARLVPESGYEIEYLNLSGFAGRGPVARLMALFQFAGGLIQMRGIVRRFQPELVLGTGGYVSGPAVLAGHRAGLPTIIQEQNSIPGKMNRFLARFVDEVHVAYTESRMYFRETGKIRLSGNPVRIRQPRGSQVGLFRNFSLDPERQTVLVVGGSRGARSLNRAIVEALPLLARRSDLQFVIQTGQDDVATVQAAADGCGARAVVRPFFSPIEEVYSLATIVVCRAGAMTLAEIAQFALPAILVPFPFAIYQHQLMNARILADKGAAEVILDKDLSGKLLAERIEALLADRARRREMGLNAWNLARPDAHERLVNAIEALTHPVEKKGAADLVEAEAAEAAEGRRS